jgi:hypothetical protein
MVCTTTFRETAMATRHLSTALAGLAWGICLAVISPATRAADNFIATTGTEQAAKPQKSKSAKHPKSPTDKGTGENKAERDKRLLRECKGKANAGACEGYAS